MKITHTVPGILFLIFLQIHFPAVYSQAGQQKASRQSAMDALSKDNFELAYKHFSELSTLYPKDILYKYYCGVCLVRLKRDPFKASSLLLDAIRGSMAIRSVPQDGFFYLGRAQQMSGKYSEAIKSYNSFTEQAGKKASREAGVPQFLQQCNEKKGELAVVAEQKPDMVKKDSLFKTSVTAAPKVETAALKQIDTITKHKELLPENYDILLSRALDYQIKADSLSGLAAEYHKQIETADDDEKADLKAKAQNLENFAALNRKIGEQVLAEAHNLSLKPEKNQPDAISGKILARQDLLKADSIKAKVVETEPLITKDSVKFVKEKKAEKTVEPGTDYIVQSVPEIFSIFGIQEKPVYFANEKAKVNPEVPSGLIYRIQIAVFRNPVALAYFKGIDPVFGFRNEGAEVANYYAGMFRKSADAAKALNRVKALGFKDAFIVALFEKKIVSADRAAILEKEWGAKSLIVTKQKIADIQRDTVPPTLVFRVEVSRSVKPLPPDQMENIKKLAGSRGLDIVMNDTKQNILLIGKFLTFESASEYSDLLVRNGLREAKVVAYLGKKEIPVETAKQLFEKQ